MAFGVRKGDQVRVITGKDRGKEGKVLAVNVKNATATVEAVNIYSRHERPKRQGQKGQKVQVPIPVQISNLLLICPHCSKPTRTGRATNERGIKVRVCKKCTKRI